jgi:hypothetical protein
MSGQVVDTPTAAEFLTQVLAVSSFEDLAVIAGDLERKSAAMRALVGDDPAAMSSGAVRELLGWVFCTRRRVDRVLAVVDAPELAVAIADLVGGSGGLVSRYDRFAGLLEELPVVAADLPGELLHFLDPGRYWLLTRWLWDADAETGALRLVTMDEVDLDGDSPGEIYLAAGRALAFVEETGKAAGFTAMGAGMFGTDVFLAAVYSVYLHTVLRMRMTNEFTKVVPQLPDLVRRLLGVYHMNRKA